MSIQIKLKNSVVQDSTPSTSDLPAVGEIALNANINSIGGFMRASDNSIVKIFGPGSLSTPTATTTVPGISELATNTETTTGTATNRVVTPAGLNAVTVAERTTSNTNYVAKAGSTLTGVLTMPNGSNSAPAINFGDSDSGIFGGTNTVSLTAGGTTRLTADTGVSVVGTLAVTGAITSTSDLTIADKIIHAGDTNTAIRFPATDTISFETQASEKFRVDSGGHISIGTSTSRSIGGSVERKLQIEATDGSAGISITRNGSANTPAFLSFGKQRSGAVGGNTIVLDDDQLGQIHFAGADGTDIASIAASISAFVDGTPGSNDMPGRLVFSTTADGAASPTTRLTIDSAGLVKLPDNGKFVAGAGSDLQIYHDGSNSIIADSGTGELRLDSNTLRIRNAAGSETSAVFVENGACQFRFDNSLKLETTSTGSQTTGMHLVKGHSDIDNQFNPLLFLQDSTNTAIKAVFLLEDDYTTGRAALAINVGEAGVTNDRDLMLQKAGGRVGIRCTPTTSFEVSGASKFNGSITLGDNNQLRLGADNDAQIYHDNTDLHINNTAGVIKITKNSELGVVVRPNNNVELYFDNSKKLETTSGGVDITGTMMADGIQIQDTHKINLGNSQDLQIYHNGSHSYIQDAGTGNLYVYSNYFIVSNAAGNEDIIKGAENGAVELYYDGSKKFETTSTGVKLGGDLDVNNSNIKNGTAILDITTNQRFEFDIAGTTVVDINGGGVDFKAGNNTHADNVKSQFGTSNDLQIYHDGSDSVIKDAGTGRLSIQTSHLQVANAANSETMLNAFENGAVELYFDNSKKFETTSTGVSFANGADATTSKLILALGNASTKEATIQGTSQNTNEKGIAFKTFSFTAKDALTLTPAGLVGMGTTSPQGRLHLSSGTSGDCELILEADTDNNDENDIPIIKFRQDGGLDLSAIGTGQTGTDSDNHLTLSNSAANGGISFRTGTTNGFTNATEAVRISSSGAMGIGSTNPDAHSSDSKLSIQHTSATHQLVSINRPNSTTGCLFVGNSGANEAIVASNNADLRIGRSLGGTFNERMRVQNANGKVLINRTNLDGSGMLQIAVSGAGITTATADQGTVTHLEFRNQNGNVGTIKTNGTNTSFNTASDYRLKENVAAIADGIRRLKQLKPKKFNFISDETDTLLDGFLAHEVSPIIPEAVSGEKDEVDTDGKPLYQEIDHSKLVPLLVAAVQELIGRVETLEAA